MPYTSKQCRFFGANQGHAPEDWKSKCKEVEMTDEGMDENEIGDFRESGTFRGGPSTVVVCDRNR